MKFLLDVHVAAAIARALEENGHEVVRAAVDHSTWTDDELLDLAVREMRFIVTEDRDFSDLIYAHGMPPPPGITISVASRRRSLQWRRECSRLSHLDD